MANEPVILRRDFYKSLLTAFTEGEIGSQLARMNLTRLLIDVPDDRHWVVEGDYLLRRACEKAEGLIVSQVDCRIEVWNVQYFSWLR